MPPDALSLAMLGPASAGSSAEVASEAAAGAGDAEIVAEGVLSAIDARDPAALATALRDLLDVIRAEHHEEEAAEGMDD